MIALHLKLPISLLLNFLHRGYVQTDMPALAKRVGLSQHDFANALDHCNLQRAAELCKELRGQGAQSLAVGRKRLCVGEN